MFIAFLLEGIGIYALLQFAHEPLLFVLLSGLVFFAWGEIYSLFPATCTDLYGKKFATTNYGMLYTAKGTAALLVPLANVLTAATGSWTAVSSWPRCSTSSRPSWRSLCFARWYSRAQAE
jgi:OFA family oxalate/formate antiporter-like MFS transporter